MAVRPQRGVIGGGPPNPPVTTASARIGLPCFAPLRPLRGLRSVGLCVPPLGAACRYRRAYRNAHNRPVEHPTANANGTPHPRECVQPVAIGPMGDAPNGPPRHCLTASPGGQA